MVITDNVMPIMTGVEMVAEIKSLRPQTFILFLTANPDQSFLSLLHAKESIQYLPKPAKIEKIFSLVDGYIGNCQ